MWRLLMGLYISHVSAFDGDDELFRGPVEMIVNEGDTITATVPSLGRLTSDKELLDWVEEMVTTIESLPTVGMKKNYRDLLARLEKRLGDAVLYERKWSELVEVTGRRIAEEDKKNSATASHNV
ncbi:MAG: hypothetical protein MZV63_15490 [Marinilabiliales bacterium]|nr:hypothetical protein [Marinilabiliales bacterium]